MHFYSPLHTFVVFSRLKYILLRSGAVVDCKNFNRLFRLNNGERLIFGLQDTKIKRIVDNIILRKIVALKN